MIILEFFSEISRNEVIKDEMFEVISEGRMVALLPNSCVDEWVYDLECAEGYLRSSYRESIELFKSLIKRYSKELTAAVLSPSVSRYFSNKIILALYTDSRDDLNDIYCIYISGEGALHSTIMREVLLRIEMNESLGMLDTSMPIELKFKVRSIDEVANKLSDLSFDVTKGYIREGDVFAVRKLI